MSILNHSSSRKPLTPLKEGCRNSKPCRSVSGVFALALLVLVPRTVISQIETEAESATAPVESVPAMDLIRNLVSESRDEQERAIEQIGVQAETSMVPALSALRMGSLYLWTPEDGSGRVVIAVEHRSNDDYERELRLQDALTEAAIHSADGKDLWVSEKHLRKASANNALKRKIRPVMDRLSLMSPDKEARRSAATKLGNSQDPEVLPLLEEALKLEKDPWAKHALEEAIWIIKLVDSDEFIRITATEKLAELHAPNGLVFMQRLLETTDGVPAEASEKVRESAEKGIAEIKSYQFGVELVGTAFYGLSLSAVLLIVALGLGITFGLMGVINMAHGELMMIGAYTAFVIQNIFRAYVPESMFDLYFLVALPASFLVAGLIGLAMEGGVVRFLYGRPLETILLTWGISLILQQAVRHYFGAANVDVTAPSWLSGGLQVMVGLVLPWNRLFIILSSVVCLGAVYCVLFRTGIGLRIRCVTQNREMSSCLGIATRRVDAWTFAFGAGLAGIAGCELSILGNVGPDLGQTYIVDSFMVVVLGGVGKLAGIVTGAFGIGFTTKIIEPFADAVMGKVFVLAMLIIFLQRRPGGLFPARGRHAEI